MTGGEILIFLLRLAVDDRVIPSVRRQLKNRIAAKETGEVCYWALYDVPLVPLVNTLENAY